MTASAPLRPLRALREIRLRTLCSLRLRRLCSLRLRRHLSHVNIEYHAKRGSGRLGPVAVTRLAPGSADAHRAAHVRAGQREAQFKPVILQYRKDLRWTPDEYVLS